MGSLSIWHWIVVIAVVLLLFGRGKISDLMGDVAQGIKAFKKGMQDDDKTAEKPEPVKTIDHNAHGVHGGAVGRRQQGCLNTAPSRPRVDLRQVRQTGERKARRAADRCGYRRRCLA